MWILYKGKFRPFRAFLNISENTIWSFLKNCVKFWAVRLRKVIPITNHFSSFQTSKSNRFALKFENRHLLKNGNGGSYRTVDSQTSFECVRGMCLWYCKITADSTTCKHWYNRRFKFS